MHIQNTEVYTHINVFCDAPSLQIYNQSHLQIGEEGGVRSANGARPKTANDEEGSKNNRLYIIITIIKTIDYNVINTSELGQPLTTLYLQQKAMERALDSTTKWFPLLPVVGGYGPDSREQTSRASAEEPF